jgi:hypothetical protein
MIPLNWQNEGNKLSSYLTWLSWFSSINNHTSDTYSTQQECKLFITGHLHFASTFLCACFQNVDLRFSEGSFYFLPFAAKRLAKAYPSKSTGVNLNDETESRTRNLFCCSG